MKVKVLEEHGHDAAMRGMAYSFKDRAEEGDAWWESKRERAKVRLAALAHRGGGHNKALESIQVWIDVEATRSFWQEFDTYRVGTTKQSESTVHTLSKRAPTQEDFEVDTPPVMVQAFQTVWQHLKENGMNISVLKNSLPEGFLQRRIVCTNYKVLQNIIAQRKGHRYKWWDVFINELLAQVEHPEYLVEPVK